MANQKGTGTTWNLPNYAGDLFTADTTNTPILSAIGGLTGGVQTDNFEFPTDSQYSLPEAAQPAITETASLTAPQAEEIVRTQNTNVTQIFHEKVSISYVKESNRGRMSGLNTAGQKKQCAVYRKGLADCKKAGKDRPRYRVHHHQRRVRKSNQRRCGKQDQRPAGSLRRRWRHKSRW